MPTLTLLCPDGSIASVLLIPSHATAQQIARIVSAGLALAHARGWSASLATEVGPAVAWSREQLGARHLMGAAHA